MTVGGNGTGSSSLMGMKKLESQMRQLKVSNPVGGKENNRTGSNLKVAARVPFINIYLITFSFYSLGTDFNFT